MGNFLSAALRGHLPEAALLPLLLVIVIMGVLALGLRLNAMHD